MNFRGEAYNNLIQLFVVNAEIQRRLILLICELKADGTVWIPTSSFLNRLLTGDIRDKK